MKPARTLSSQERAILAAKLAQMQAAIARKNTTRNALRAVVDARSEEVTRNDLPAFTGRYSLVGEGR